MDPIDPQVTVPRIALERVLEHVRDVHAQSMDAWCAGEDLPGALDAGDAAYFRELEQALLKPSTAGGAAEPGGPSSPKATDLGAPAPPAPPAAGAAAIAITIHGSTAHAEHALRNAEALAFAARHRTGS
jgi:hypothetical protein